MDYFSIEDITGDFFAKKSIIEGSSSFDECLDYFMSDDAKLPVNDTEAELNKAKMEVESRQSTPKKKKSTTSSTTIVPKEPSTTVVSYSNTYNETTDMLRQAILQAEQEKPGTIFVNGNLNEGFKPYFRSL